MEGRARSPQGPLFLRLPAFVAPAALINAVVLLAGSIFILSRAIPRLIEPEHADPGGMLALAILGIVVNGAAVLRLRGGKTMNARMIAWHLLEDVLGWVAVLIVSISLLITDFHILDPLLSILITCYILYNVVRNLRKTLAIFCTAPRRLPPPPLRFAMRSAPLTGALQPTIRMACLSMASTTSFTTHPRPRRGHQGRR